MTSRYVPTGPRGSPAQQQWGESSIRQGESSGTITHEIIHTSSRLGDNNNNPYVTPYHRVGSGTVGHDGPRLVQRPRRPAQPLAGAAQYGGVDGAEHDAADEDRHGLRARLADVLRLNRNGLAQSGLAVADVIARAVNAEPAAGDGIRWPASRSSSTARRRSTRTPACDVNTNPLCDGGGRRPWTNYTLETVQRIGYGSFEPDNGVLIAKNKTWTAARPRHRGLACGYNCFTWVEDAHPEDINMVDYLKPRTARP